MLLANSFRDEMKLPRRAVPCRASIIFVMGFRFERQIRNGLLDNSPIFFSTANKVTETIKPIAISVKKPFRNLALMRQHTIDRPI